MAKPFDTWTVLPHGPLEKHAENLWSVSGTMPRAEIQRRMTIARLANGALCIHNAVALEEPLMAELEAFGEPAVLLVPNGFHRQDALIYKQRYPKLKVLCPRGASGSVKKVVPPDGTYDDLPSDNDVSVFNLLGMKEREGAMLVRSSDGVSMVFCDAVLNMQPKAGLMGFFRAPTGRPSVPRSARWLLINDRRALRGHLEKLSTPDLQRVFVGHGATIAHDAPAALRAVAAGLG